MQWEIGRWKEEVRDALFSIEMTTYYTFSFKSKMAGLFPQKLDRISNDHSMSIELTFHHRSERIILCYTCQWSEYQRHGLPASIWTTGQCLVGKQDSHQMDRRELRCLWRYPYLCLDLNNAISLRGGRRFSKYNLHPLSSLRCTIAFGAIKTQVFLHKSRKT